MRTRPRYSYSGMFDDQSEPQPADMAGLLQDVLDHPDDDRYRLIFADYSEDVGQPDVARFIRGDMAFQFKARHFWDWYYTPTLQKIFGKAACSVTLLEGWPAAPRWCVCLIAGAFQWELTFRVGFVEHIRLPCEHWMKHGRNLVKEFPLLSVRLDDREPSDWQYAYPMGPNGHVGWWSDGEREFVRDRIALPHSLWLKLPTDTTSRVEKNWQWYADPTVAHDALSVACLALVDAPASRVTSSRR